MPKTHSLKYLLAMLCVAPNAWCAASGAGFTMAQVLHYPYASQLTSAERADTIAWVRTLDGVRNVWLARGPSFVPLQVTHNSEDDGQEITQLTFSPDGSRLVFVRGGDHDANWPAEGNLSPDPASSPVQPETSIWSVPLTGAGEPVKLAEGDAPAISAQGQLAYVKDDHVWTVPLDGGKSERLFFDRGKDGDLRWSPDGSRLAFVSNRGDHAFIGIFSSKDAPLVYLAPATGKDGSPRWSPDGTQVAFVRQPGDGGPPEPVLTPTPHPWSIWVATAARGVGSTAVAESEDAGGLVSRRGGRSQSALDGRPIDLHGVSRRLAASLCHVRERRSSRLAHTRCIHGRACCREPRSSVHDLRCEHRCRFRGR